MTMTFGKYRGCPMADVARDESYIGWLFNQHWFPTKYPEVHAALVALTGRRPSLWVRPPKPPVRQPSRPVPVEVPSWVM